VKRIGGYYNFISALGIERVQYRFFIGTGAKRSPEKPDPCAAWVTPKSFYIFEIAVGDWQFPTKS
jgi:hypothetical protein